MGTMSGLLLAKNMSTGIGDGVGERFEYIDELAEFLSNKTAEVVTQAAPAISEVVIAAADSWPPIAFLQYFIDGIHTFTGFNWWASIVIATLVIRTLTIPIMINQLKASTKLNILRPELDQINQEMQDKGMDPSVVSEGQAKIMEVFSKYGDSPLTPFKGALIQDPVFVSFFLAIQNMADKVPSFQTGGVSWFTDLTTANPTNVLPCLAAFSYWMTVEALFCYWITSNLFSLVYGLVIKRKRVKEVLNIPIIVPPPIAIAQSRPPVSFWDSMKKYAAAQAMEQQKLGNSKPSLMSRIFYPPRLSGRISSEENPQRISSSSSSSSSVLNNRIKNLEKQAKGRKKSKGRPV